MRHFRNFTCLWLMILATAVYSQDSGDEASKGENARALADIAKLKADIASIPKLVEILANRPVDEVIDAGLAFLEQMDSQRPQVITGMLELANHADARIKSKSRQKLFSSEVWLSGMRKMLARRDYRYKREIVLLLAERGKDEIPALVALFKSPYKRDREIATEGLTKIGSAVVFPLFTLIEEDEQSQSIQEDVIKILQNLGMPAVTPLVLLLTAPSKSTRKIARDALIGFGKDGIAPALEVFYMNPNSQLNEALQEVCYGIGLPSIPEILPLITQRIPGVRSLAEETIRKFGKEAFPFLLDTFNSAPSDEVKEQALIGMASVAPQEEEEVQKLLPLLRPLLESKSKLQYPALCVIRNMKDAAKEVIPELQIALNSGSAKVREVAAYSLANAGEDSKPVLKLLIRCLEQEENGEVKIAICKAIGNMGPSAQAAIPRLRKGLQDYDELVIMAAAEALGKIGPSAKEAIPELIATFTQVGSQDRKTISWAIAQMGRDAVQPLRNMLRPNEPYEEKRAGAALALGYLKEEAKPAVNELIRALIPTEPEQVKTNAAFALGEIGMASDTVIKALIDSCGSSEMVGEAVSEALAKLGEPCVRRIILAIRYSDNFLTRVAMIRALGKMELQDNETISLLLKTLRKSESLEERETIVETLGKVGRKNEEAMAVMVNLLVTEKNPEFHAVLCQTLLQYGEAVIPSLIPLLAEQKEITQKSLAFIFCRFGNLAVSHLRKEIRPDNKTNAVVNAMMILAENPKNIPIIIEPLTFDNEEIRRQAVDLLSRKIGEQAISYLISALLDSKTSEKRALIRKPLVVIGEPAVPPLLAIIQSDPQKESRIIAIDTIAEIGPQADQSVETLVKILDQSPLDEQVRIIYCLGRLGSTAIPHLVKLLGHANEAIRHAVIKALGDTNSEEAVLYLLKTLDVPELLPLVIEAMVGMKAIAIPVLLNSLQDQNTHVRFACAAAIFEIGEPQAIPYLQIQIQAEKDPMVKYMLTTALKACQASK